MKMIHLSKIQLCHIDCICSLLAGYKVHHFQKTINYHIDRIITPLHPWQSQNKDHTHFNPWLCRDRQVHIQSSISCLFLLHLTYTTMLHKPFNLFTYRQPKIRILHQLQSYVTRHMTLSIKLLNNP